METWMRSRGPEYDKDLVDIVKCSVRFCSAKVSVLMHWLYYIILQSDAQLL